MSQGQASLLWFDDVWCSMMYLICFQQAASCALCEICEAPHVQSSGGRAGYRESHGCSRSFNCLRPETLQTLHRHNVGSTVQPLIYHSLEPSFREVSQSHNPQIIHNPKFEVRISARLSKPETGHAGRSHDMNFLIDCHCKAETWLELAVVTSSDK